MKIFTAPLSTVVFLALFGDVASADYSAVTFQRHPTALFVASSRQLVAAESPAPYVMVVPQWPISVIGDGYGAGTEYPYYYSWNGHALSVARVDDSGSESFNWDAQVLGVNAGGMVVGNESETLPPSTSGIPASTLERALAMRGGVPLPYLNSTEDSATAVNNAGDVIGFGGGYGFVVRNGQPTMSLTAFARSPFLNAVVPSALNARGDVAGTSNVTMPFGNQLRLGPTPLRVFLLGAGDDPARVRDLGAVPFCPQTSVAGIDANDVIAGTCAGTAAPVAWTWEAGVYKKLSPLPGDDGATATGVTDDGTIAGSSSHGNRQRAVIWRKRRPQLVADLVADTKGRPFDTVTSISPGGWMLVASQVGDTTTNLIVAPAASGAAAAELARAFPSPSPTPEPTDAPSAAPAATTATDAPPAPTPTPQFTFTPLRTTEISPAAMPAVTKIRWSLPADSLVTDGTHAYAGVGTTVRALDSSGHAIWRRTVGQVTGDANSLYLAGPYVLSGGSRWYVLDAASGAVRWSHPEPTASRVDGNVVTLADASRVRRFALDTGAELSASRLPDLCSPDLLTGQFFGCFSDDQTETRVLSGFATVTGKKVWDLPGMPYNRADFPEVAGSFYVDFNTLVVAVHPAIGTYDILDVPFGNYDDVGAPPLHAYARGYGFIAAAPYVVRYRLDRDPATGQDLERFPDDGTVVFENGVIYRRSPTLGFVVTTFGEAGPSAIAFPALSADAKGALAVSGSYAVLGFAKGVTVIDLAHRRIVARTSTACDAFNGVAISGTTAIVGCGTDGETMQIVGFDLTKT